MTDPLNTETASSMTVAEAAKAVRRPVTTIFERKDASGNVVKKSVTTQVKVDADEVLSFKDFGGHVVVVTKDGQKFSSADSE